MESSTHHPSSKHATPQPKTGFESWADGIDKANEKWNTYDCDVRSAVGEYNAHLSHTPGYVPLDWQPVKAMLWVETGANVLAWKSRPMQIGKPRMQD